MRLTAKGVKGRAQPGKYYDGDGLLLHVMSATRRLWFFRYQRNRKERMMGLGSAAVVSLDAARKTALEARELLACRAQDSARGARAARERHRSNR